ncbi:intradiol ring-cleavage dioxygenase [Micromonospora sp. MS34]|uniref:intradiol ring-cleavage dioxygenase n=1 Tax=Micromonospora sp. MS34 TaxID=3385971 RepID=UPI00399F9998
MHSDQPRRAAPTYRGRPLARPEEDIEDQGLGFDLGTLLGRRQLFRVLGVGATGVALAACGSTDRGGSRGDSSAQGAGTATAATAGEIPDETAGPYPGDGSNGPDVLEESGIVRSDIRGSFGDATGTAEGVPMTLELTIQDLANGGTPFAGTAVYVWHCDRAGRYSLYSQGVTGANYLRGVQVADAAGKVRFTSVFPACYAGRWPHIHFEVYPDGESINDAAKAIATSQMALPRDVCDTVYAQAGYEQSVTNLAGVSLDSDNVFGDDGGATQLATVVGDVTSGFTVALAVRVDTRTAPTGGQLAGNGRPPGDAPGPGGSGGPGGPPSNGSPPSAS